MRITFVDGATKGFKDENVVSHEFGEQFLNLQMKDGSEFVFPIANIREVKLETPGNAE